MKSAAARQERRPYRQSARAEAAEATGRRILDAFQDAMRDDWLADITLDQVARSAGVTVQTLIRRFGGKDGLLRAVREHMERDVMRRREIPVGDLECAVANLCVDYEASGDMIVRILAQEGRFPDLTPLLDFGRERHRHWVSQVAAPWLQTLSEVGQQRAIDTLVAAMDVYVWKLVRRDMGRSHEETRRVILRLAAGIRDQISQDSLTGGKPWASESGL